MMFQEQHHKTERKRGAVMEQASTNTIVVFMQTPQKGHLAIFSDFFYFDSAISNFPPHNWPTEHIEHISNLSSF